MYSAVQDKSANYTVVAGDAGDLIRVTTTSGAVTITLPTISTVGDGFKVAIVKWTGDANAVNVVRSSTNTINGATSATIGSQYSSTIFVADFETNQWFAASSGLGATNIAVDAFSGNGSTTAFTLSGDPGSENNTQVYVSGVYQEKDTYSVSGTTLTFSTAPPTGTSNIEVVSSAPLAIGTPSDGTVTTAKLASTTGSGAVVLATSPTITTPVISSLSSASATALTLQSAGTTAITVDTSQNVGIGVTPSAWNSGNNVKALQISTFGAMWQQASGAINVGANVYEYAASAFKYITSNPATLYSQDTGNGIHTWSTAASGTAGNVITFSERMRIANNGYIGFNTSSFSNSNGAPGFVYSYSGGAQNIVNTYTSSAISYGAIFEYRRTGRPNSARCAQIGIQESGSGVGEVYVFSSAQNADVSGGVYISNGATSWSAVSDERLKDIIEPITNGLTKVSTLRTVIGKYKTDAEGTRRSFLIAQDVQAVLPEAISATRVQNDDAEYLGVSYTDVIPLLVASIKELKAINDTQAETITALTARIVALEN
jgi:hypothetical protein